MEFVLSVNLFDNLGMCLFVCFVLPRYKLISWTFRPIFRMNHEQHVRKPSAKVSAVGVMVPRALWRVNVHALWTVALDHGLARQIAQAKWQHGLRLAIDAWTVAKVASLVFLNHLRDAAVRENVSRVDQPVEHLGSLLNKIRLILIVLQFVICKKKI